jgi:2-phospho-L-lactate guanylyltransferase
MSLWAIIPVKPLRRAKSRLSGVLSEEERTHLNNSMLINTLKTVKSVSQIEKILVISKDPAALALARDYGGRTVQEDGNPGLNTALQRAIVVANIYNARGILIIPADLPFLKVDDLTAFIACSGNPPEVIISSDRRGKSTNALLVSPAGLFDYRFGSNSFAYNIQQAKNLGARLEICNIQGLRFDLDLPEDFADYRRHEYSSDEKKSQ